MAGIPGNPLGYARDIAEGNAPFTVLQLKRRMTGEELKKVFVNLQIVLREVRTTGVADRDIEGMRRRAHKLQRLNNAVFLLETRAKKLRIIL